MWHKEKETVWNTFIEVANKVDFNNIKFDAEALSLVNDVCGDIEKNITIQCEKLAFCSDKDTDLEKSEILKLKNEGKIVESQIFVRLARHFFLDNKINGNERSGKLSNIFYTLFCHIGVAYYYSVEYETIEKVLILACQYRKEHPYPASATENRIVESAKHLKNHGFQLSVEQGTISYEIDTSKKIFDKLEEMIVSVTGNAVLSYVLNKYLKDYNQQMDRYIIVRKFGEYERNVPLNLLINISAKHLSSNSNYRRLNDGDARIKEIFKFAEAVLDIHDIQAETHYQHSTLDVENFPLYMQNELVFEKLCIPTQYSKEFILKSLDYVIKPLFKLAGTVYRYEDYYKFAHYMLRRGDRFGFIDINHVSHKTGISICRLKMMLKDISMPASEVNKSFDSIEKSTNLFMRPIISFCGDKYLFIDQHLSGIGFYHAAYELIKKHKDNVDRYMGTYVEEMLKGEMNKRGFDYSFGKYYNTANKHENECDLVVSDNRAGEEQIVFVEIKKRSTSDEMNELDDVGVLSSLARGMIKAQEQCFTHEACLKEQGELILSQKDNGKCPKSEFGLKEDEKAEDENEIKITDIGSQSYKISVCFPEYSFLCNKMFTRTLILTLLVGSFEAVDSEKQELLNGLDKCADTIRDCATRIRKKGFKGIDIANCSLFCSMQQILTAIWCAEDKDEFLDILYEWLYSSDGTLDLYVTLKKYLNNKDNIFHNAVKELHKKSNPILIIR